MLDAIFCDAPIPMSTTIFKFSDISQKSDQPYDTHLLAPTSELLQHRDYTVPNPLRVFATDARVGAQDGRPQCGFQKLS